MTVADQATILGVGVAAVLALAAGAFRLISLRSDFNARWTSRVDLATVALTEKTISELRGLSEDIEAFLPERFEPEQAVADPAPLSQRAADTADFYRAGERMRSSFSRMRAVGPALVIGLALMAPSTAVLAVIYAELIDLQWLRFVCLVVLGLATVVTVAAGVTYAVLMSRLTRCEELAGTAGQSGARVQ